MNAISRVLIATAFLLQTAGCAHVRAGVDDAVRPGDATAAVVVGRNLLSLNGQEVQRTVMIHVSQYLGTEALARSPYAPGQFAIRVLAGSKGYFAVNLPPGNYYIVEFGILPGTPRLPSGFRSYMPILWSKVSRPLVHTFSVEAGKATYIGTLHTKFADVETDLGERVMWNTVISDESTQAEQWLGQKYPDWKGHFSTNLVTTYPASNPTQKRAVVQQVTVASQP